MAFTSNTVSSVAAEINVTPLIDVLLVLLIVFMVIAPLAPRGLQTLVPEPQKDVNRYHPEAAAVVLEVSSCPHAPAVYRVNGEEANPKALPSRLADLLSVRQDKTLFIRATRIWTSRP